VWCASNRYVVHSRNVGPLPDRARPTAAVLAASTFSGSWPSIVKAGIPNARARPVILPATADSTGIVVA
jgi:hypothetical protein